VFELTQKYWGHAGAQKKYPRNQAGKLENGVKFTTAGIRKIYAMA
jgi:hypothetical protein